jgi:hypothetical protein
MEIVMTRFTLIKLSSGLLTAAFAASLNASAHAAATPITKAQYDDAKARAEAAYKIDREKCDSLAGNAKDICVAEAKGQLTRSEAKAKAEYKNTRDAWYDEQVKNAEADYLVAKEKCDNLGGNDKDVCVKEAKAARTKAMADAKARRKTADAQGEARKESNEARHDAAEQKRDADYKVELQRCDDLSGDAKDACVQRAKRTFGKS